jgi:hypothetical protein
MRRAARLLFRSFHAIHFACSPVVVLAGLVAGGYLLLHPAPVPEPEAEAPPDAAWFEERFAEIQAIDARSVVITDAARRLYMDGGPAKLWEPAETLERGRLSREYAELQETRQRLVAEYNEKAAAVDGWDHPTLPRYIAE